MKDGPMVANAGLVTETEVRREMTSLGLKAYEAWREGGREQGRDGWRDRESKGEKGRIWREGQMGRERGKDGRERKEGEGQGEKGTCKCTFLTNTNPKFQFKGTHNLRLHS